MVVENLITSKDLDEEDEKELEKTVKAENREPKSVETQDTEKEGEITALRKEQQNNVDLIGSLQKQIDELKEKQEKLKEQNALYDKKIEEIENLKTQTLKAQQIYQYYTPCLKDQNLNFLFTEERQRMYKELEDSDNERNVLYNSSSSSHLSNIKFCSLNKLISKLVTEENDVVHTFLLTYKTYTTSEEVLKKLMLVYDLPPSRKNVTWSEFEVFLHSRLIPIRKRVISILLRWISEFYADFRNDKILRNMLMNFAKTMTASESMRDEGELLLKVMLSQMNRIRRTFEEQQHQQQNRRAYNTPDKLAKQKTPLQILEGFGVDELVETITIIEFAQTFRFLKPKEFLNSAWSDEQREQNAPNVHAMIMRSNLLTTWICSSILHKSNVKDRGLLLTKVCKMALKAASINNFNLLIEIWGALNSNPIFRLRKTWEQVPKKTLDEYMNLKALTSSNSAYKGLREAVKAANPPCLPYLGMFLTDLTFIEDGNVDSKDGLIHFAKCSLLADVIRTVQYYQNYNYSFELKPELYSQLSHLKLSDVDQDLLYELSLKLEPRVKA